jgi:hypothetical protein
MHGAGSAPASRSTTSDPSRCCCCSSPRHCISGHPANCPSVHRSGRGLLAFQTEFAEQLRRGDRLRD